MKNRKRLIIAGGAGALLLVALFAGSMAVQAFGPARWMAGGFHGCGFHPGFGGGKGLGDFIIWRMDETVKDLNLNTAQREKYDRLRTGVKSHVSAAAENHMLLREEIHTEMTKDVPDVAAVAPRVKNAITGISADLQDNIDLFTAFYGSLDANQKKKVMAGVQERMAAHDQR